MAKAFSRFAGEQPPPTDETPNAPRAWRCMCNGCPVVAGIDAGNGDTICRFHYGEPSSSWQRITKALRQREWLVRLADWLFGDPAEPTDWPRRAAEVCEAAGRPELSPTTREVRPGVMRDERQSPRLYAYRLNAALANECAVERRAPVTNRKDSDRPLSVGELIVGMNLAQE